MEKEQLRLYGVTDRTWLNGRTLESVVEEAILGGTTFIQFREKELMGEELIEQARRVQKVCRDHGVPFVINDNVDLAKSIDADGVHLGQGDMGVREARKILGPRKIIGITAKTVEQARAAEAGGADYLGSGAVFWTSTKKDALPMSKELLKQIVEGVDIPVVAIGGITAENVAQLSGTGIAGVAVVSGLFAQSDIRKAAETILSLL